MKLYQLIKEDDTKLLLEAVSKLEWNTGQARTKELTGTVKQNLEILSSHSKDAKQMLSTITNHIMQHRAISLDCIPLKIHPPKFSKYVVGARYHPHTDAPWMGETRTDISCTLWLSEPDSYKGGDLNVNGQNIKGKPGQILFYDCGTVHSVSPVTEGERICVVTWVQSRIRDPIKRKLITDFRKWLSKMEGTELFNEGSPIYSSLLKRWIE